MNKIKLYFLLSGFLILTSCNYFEKKELQYSDIKIESRPDDFKVPKKIFDQIEADLLGTSPAQSVFLYTPIQVVLFSESNGVIKNSPTRISFPNGGGQLDLANYVIGAGSFYLSFPKDQFETLPFLENLYFISDTPKKKIEKEEFGLGCGKFVDIKKQFESLQKINFLKLYTTDLRYLYVVSGYYIFVFKKNNQVFLTHLRVTDSRYPDSFCSSLYIE